MSLRPNARTEVRRSRYKVAVDADEGRRRREDNMVEIRKNKREESLLKKRREGLLAQPQLSSSLTTSSALDNKKVFLFWFSLPLLSYACSLDNTVIDFILFFLLKNTNLSSSG